MKWIFGIIGAAVLLAAVAVIRGGHGSGNKAVDEQLIVKVRKGDLEVVVSETGKVEPRAKAEIKSKVAGQVVSVFIREGEHVKMGQKLIQLDPIDYRREVERAQADLEQGRVQAEFAEAQLLRRAKALEGRGVSQAEYDTAKNEVAVAKSRIALAQVTLQSAQDKLRYTTITSPMDGVVIQRGIEPGEVVTPGVAATFEGKPLLVVADLSELKVKINLNQIDVAKVKLEQPVDVTVDALAGKKFVARVSKVAPAAVLEKGKDVETFPVEATLMREAGGRPNDSGSAGDAFAIKPGMTADVKIKIDKKPNVLVLPIEAVVNEKAKQFGRAVGAEKNFVWLVERSGKEMSTKKVEVDLGERNDREVELTKGVSENQEILVQPSSAEANEVKM